jgi:hypothetical protein
MAKTQLTGRQLDEAGVNGRFEDNQLRRCPLSTKSIE